MTHLREALVAWAAGADVAAAREPSSGLRAVALVEGVSDQAAVERLAVRRGRDLDAEGVCVVPMGGATNIRRFVDLLGPHGLDVPIVGLCDRAELGFFERALVRAGMGLDGIFVCDPDLEGELIRALGPTVVERVIALEGESRAYDIFRQQPAQRERSAEDRLHRFMGTHSGRKEQYGRVLVDALDLDDVPSPLGDLLDRLRPRDRDTGCMDLPVAWSLVLIVTAVWNFVIWPPFLKRVRKDERSRDAAGNATTFLRVHTILIAISLALAVAVGVLGIVTLF